MASGGARAVSGPPPDPNALRRDKDHKEWTTLPLHRTGKPPRWPLPGQSARERTLWAEFWTMPQALMWERNRQFIEVAVFVRTLAEAETPALTNPVPLRTLLRQQMEALGLSLPGMLRLGWRIAEEQKAQPAPRARAGLSARERLRLIEGSA